MNKLAWGDFDTKHKGQRCFILGNAPNLIEEELELLKDEKVFITNRGYKALDHGLDHYDYLVVCDLVVYQDFHAELCETDQGTRIYPYWFKNLPEYQEESFLPFQYHVPPGRPYGVKTREVRVVDQWPKSWQDGWGKAGNAVLNASVIAYFMGFTEIYLLGVEMVYRKGDTHFYKDTSKREEKVPDGHRSKGIHMLKFYAKKFEAEGIKFVNLSQGFPWKDRMLCDNLRNIITGGDDDAI